MLRRPRGVRQSSSSEASDCIRDRFPIEGKEYQWAKPKRHIVARKNGLAVGHIGFGRFQLCGSKDIDVIGVGGVVVRPEFQGQKVPKKMFNALQATTELDADKILKTLFCPHRLIPYYKGHNFEVYPGSVQFFQSGVYTKSEKFTLMFRGELSCSGGIKIPSCPW